MNLADLSIRRPIFITSLVILMLAVGAISMMRLPVDLFPKVTYPVISVSTTYEGAGPKEIETLISQPIENELSTMQGLKSLRSQSTEGLSRVIAEFTLETDIKYAEQQVRDRVAGVRKKLPLDVRESLVKRRDPTDQPVAVLSFSADLPPGKMFDIADEIIRPKIEQVSQVGLVDIVGGRKRQILVELDREKLKRHEISAYRVSERVKAGGENVPAGKFENERSETVYRTLGEYHSLADIGSVIVSFIGNDVPIRLSQIGQVTDTLVEESSQSFVNGRPGLTFLVYRQSDANIVSVVSELNEQVRKINEDIQKIPGAPSLSLVQDGAKRIRANVADVKESILIGVFLTITVVFFFLGNARSTLITALALPNSLIGAFILMAAFGFTINIMTLLALSLAVGLLIDDAIVVRENIFRHMEMGKRPALAAREGTTEVTLAVVATTFTVIAVFGPIGFLQGMVGQFFREFGLTICFAMLISLFDALTIAPMLSAYLGGAKAHVAKTNRFVLKVNDLSSRFQSWLEDEYEKILHRVLHRPLTPLAGALLIFVLSIFAFQFTPKTFIPANDSGEFNVTLELPPGASLKAMSTVARQVDSVIRGEPLVKSTVLTVGSQTGPNAATIFVEMTRYEDRDISTSEFQDVVRKKLKPFAFAKPIVKMENGGGGGRQFNLNLMGSNFEELEKYSRLAFSKIRSIPALRDPELNYIPGKPELQVAIDAPMAEKLGVSTSQIGQELRNQIEGLIPAHFREDGREYDIRVRVQENQRDLQAAFNDIRVPNMNQALVPLSRVAKPVLTQGPSIVNRQDRARFIQISADIGAGTGGMASAIEETNRILKDELKLPVGIRYNFSGQAENFKELTQNMLIAIGLGVLFIYLVLASLYESFVTPLTIMIVLPLAACGAFIALFVTRSTMDMFSMIGCTMLLGIATKNSILLVDYTKQLVAGGMDQSAALIHAGRTRLRPILMTTIALIAGMAPVAIGLNEASKQRTSMGIAIIGGLISSTLLTLVVIPAAYAYVERVRVWSTRLLSGVFVKPEDAI